MKWNPEAILDDFDAVARLAHVPIEGMAIQIETLPKPHAPPSRLPASKTAVYVFSDQHRVETLPKPHAPPSRLPASKTAVYVFSDQHRVLKVGRVGPKSQARYTSQHYTGSAPSTLSGSLLTDPTMVARYGLARHNVSSWIKGNTDRVNFILDAKAGPFVLALLETFVQCRLKPVYEGGPNPR